MLIDQALPRCFPNKRHLDTLAKQYRTKTMAITNEALLLDKLRSLPDHRVAEVEDFIDFLRARTEDRVLAQASAKLSEPAFRTLWENPDDAEYDDL